jgi:maltooligosyltrehalose trehalohydrolase
VTQTRFRRFRLWSPEARAASVELRGERRPMSRDGERGWWVLDAVDAGPGTDYRMAVDDGPLRPDPRSPWQPDGVHGPSRVVDHDAFEWHTPTVAPVPPVALDLRRAVLYELHIGTFTPDGTFDAAIERLDDLVDLGVDAIELMPVAHFSGERGWGYDGVDLYAPHEVYGGPDGLRRLVDAAHARGLAVLLDVVYNHLGPEGAYLHEFASYQTEGRRTLWGAAVNFDGPDSDGVRRFVVDNALMWLRDYRIDGLRLDAVHAIEDHSAIHIVEELTSAVAALASELGRPLVVTVESDLNDPRIVRPSDLGGYGADATWADDVHHALHTMLTGERVGYYADFGTVEQLAKALRQGWVYDGCYSGFRRAIHGRPPVGLSGQQFVAALQNHDQIGNRAVGERITALTSVDRVKIGAALLLTSPFVPLLFQGEEWGATAPFQYFTDHGDPGVAQSTRDGRRAEFAPFGWRPEDVPDPQDPATFARSKLDWSERSRPPHAGLLAWYRSLLDLRRRLPDLGTGTLDSVVTHWSEDPPWLVVERGAVTVLANLGSRPADFGVDPSRPSTVLLANPLDVVVDGHGVLELPPDSVAILGP